MSKLGAASITNPPDFSLVLGGPLYQLLRRARLSDDALSLTHKRIIVMCSIAWLPLLVLSLWRAGVRRGRSRPVLLDIDVHVRFLVAMPLLIAAELVVHQRMRAVAKVFLDRHLIPDADMPRFDAAIRVGDPAAQLGVRRGVAHRPRLWRRHSGGLAPLHGARCRDVVRDVVRRRVEGLARGMLVWLREPADLPVPAVPLVLSTDHLDPLRVAGVAHRVEPGRHPSGSRRRSGISRRHGRGVRAARRRARRAARRDSSPIASSSSAPHCPISR